VSARTFTQSGRRHDELSVRSRPGLLKRTPFRSRTRVEASVAGSPSSAGRHVDRALIGVQKRVRSRPPSAEISAFSEKAHDLLPTGAGQ